MEQTSWMFKHNIQLLNHSNHHHCRGCNNILTNFHHFSPEGRGLVNKSATLSCVLTHAFSHSSLAQPSLTWWNTKLWLFFFSVDAGSVVLASTDWLSRKTNAGSSNGMPIMQSLLWRPQTYSVATFIAQTQLQKYSSQCYSDACCSNKLELDSGR